MMDEPNNVIHVTFGRDGTHRRRAPEEGRAAPGGREPAAGRASAPECPDPLADLYQRAEVSRLFGVTEGRLKYWARIGMIVPSAKVGRRHLYSFQDLISVRAANGLLEQGISSREVRASVEGLRRALPKLVRPLSEMRIVADGRTLVAQDEAGAFEPITGQLVLDFRVDSLREDVVRVLRPARAEPDRRAAYDFYLRGCSLDEDPDSYEEAEAAYREAVRLDPGFANAITNLGNLRYRRGDMAIAEELYRRALQIDPSQPEAHYNIGFLRFEEGALEEAEAGFRRAIELDSAFADAHFNLALVVEERGLDATLHWREYLQLDPSGPWAEIARRRLDGPGR